MAEKLVRTRKRLEQARVHHSRVGKLWQAFIEGDDPYTVSVEIDDDGNGGIWVHPAPLPAELSLEFGEMLYQLRATLDSLVYEVAVIDSSRDPPPDAEKLEFPIRSSKTKFNDVAWKIAPLAEQHRRMIEQVQPYHARDQADWRKRLPYDALDMLNDWARKDRHRGLLVVASWGANRNPTITELPAGFSVRQMIVSPDGLLEHESEVATFQVSGWRRGMQIEANPNLTIDIALNEPPQPRDDADTLSLRTRAMLAAVDSIINEFEETL